MIAFSRWIEEEKEKMPEKQVLRQYQSLPLDAKVHMSQARIREWYEYWNGNVFVSFSGGKDSTVLANLVHEYYPDVPLVFSNTGLEYPEIQQFARKSGAIFVSPKMSFSEVISTYGYPIISKENAEAIYYARTIRDTKNPMLTAERKRIELNGERTNERNKKSMYNKEKWLPLCQETQFMISHKCCNVMKKAPIGSYQKKNKVQPIIATLTEESKLREQAWIRHGCNAFEGAKKTSQPMSFWFEQDVLRYIVENGLEIADVYGDIVATDSDGTQYNPRLAQCGKLQCTECDRTGCIFCGFGVHLEKGETRFQRLAKTHPKQYDYCMRGGQWVDNPQYDPTAPKKDGNWENWNPKKIWTPSKEGLGMKKVFDDCNQIYGHDFIRYE